MFNYSWVQLCPWAMWVEAFCDCAQLDPRQCYIGPKHWRKFLSWSQWWTNYNYQYGEMWCMKTSQIKANIEQKEGGSVILYVQKNLQVIIQRMQIWEKYLSCCHEKPWKAIYECRWGTKGLVYGNLGGKSLQINVQKAPTALLSLPKCLLLHIPACAFWPPPSSGCIICLPVLSTRTLNPNSDLFMCTVADPKQMYSKDIFNILGREF